MDLNDIWQENKTFISGVVAGALVFLIGIFAIQSIYGDELSRARRTKSQVERQLAEARYDTTSRDLARRENESLQSALRELSASVSFEPRPEFRVEQAGDRAVNQYHRIVADVRARLLTQAGRANLFLDAELGLPELSPTSEAEIARYLEALDAVARSVQWAITAGVDRIDDVRIRLDPALNSRKGLGTTERTRVELELAGSGASMARFLRLTQRSKPQDSGSGALSVEAFDLLPARNRNEETNLALSIELVRLHGLAQLIEDSQS